MKRTALSRRPSKAKQTFDAEYAKLLPGVLAKGCEWKIYVNPCLSLGVVNPEDWACQGRLRGHHAKGRGRDGNEHVICLCDGHHQFVHAHPRWAREVGLMLSRTS